MGENAGITFDHAGDGVKQGTGWLRGDDGWLVFDRNEDGQINDGTELFGDSTWRYDGEGRCLNAFEALSQEQRTIRGFKASWMLLLIATLLFLVVPGGLKAEEGDPADSNENVAPCKDLKPYKNLDELLHQLYIGLQTDCFFEMSTAELEEAWDIKILDEERAKPKNYYPLSETEFFNKPYKTEKDAFYVQRTRTSKGNSQTLIFLLSPTREYLEKHGALFPEEKCSKMLSEGEVSDVYLYICQNENRIRRIEIDNSGSIRISRTAKMPEKESSGNEKMQDESPGESLVAIDVKAEAIPCRGLKPFNNLDELLYQFYINLDSDCLFKMPVAELEKIWNIRILSRRGMPISEYLHLKRSSDFGGKPYKTEKDALYVRAALFEEENIFNIEITKEYKDRHHSFFSENAPPQLLPKPEAVFGPLMESTNASRAGSLDKETYDQDICPGPGFNQYYWFSSDETQYITYRPWCGINSIRIQRHRPRN